MAYRRQRRNKGVEAVEKMMDSRLKVVDAERQTGFADASRVFSAWKSDILSEFPHMKDTTWHPEFA
jgi:hypothetical protein